MHWSKEQIEAAIKMLRHRDHLEAIRRFKIASAIAEAERLYEEARQAWAELVPASEREEVDLLRLADLERLSRAAYTLRSGQRHWLVIQMVQQEAAELGIELEGLDSPQLSALEACMAIDEEEWRSLVRSSGWAEDVCRSILELAENEVRARPVDYFTLGDLVEYFRRPSPTIGDRLELKLPPELPGKPLSEYLDEIRGDDPEDREGG